MDRLYAMTVFSRVARLESFAAAARELHVSTTLVSRQVAQLEAHLGVRLLQRTTRRLSLTDVGAAYLDRCEQILSDVSEVEDALREGRDRPRGRLRVSAGMSFAQEQLNARMPDLLQTYPELEIELLLTDRRVDLVGEGIDIALRVGRLSESGLFARRLCVCRHIACVSPAYAKRHGVPDAPSSLASHVCIIDTNQPRIWRFEGADGDENHEPAGPYRVNSAHAACEAVLAGFGVAHLPTFVAGPRIEQGLLQPILLDYQTTELELYAAYPERRYLSSGVRSFVEWLVKQFGREPVWDRWMDDV
ncbi:MAG: LysR family transcriptional regulator [Myxococcota bacterium]